MNEEFIQEIGGFDQDSKMFVQLQELVSIKATTKYNPFNLTTTWGVHFHNLQTKKTPTHIWIIWCNSCFGDWSISDGVKILELTGPGTIQKLCLAFAKKVNTIDC